MADQTSHRTRSQIEADLAVNRARLSEALEGLVDQVHPARIKERAITDVKTLVTGEFNNAKSQFVGKGGAVRVDRVAMIGGAVVGAVVFIAVLRKIARRGKVKGKLKS